MDYQAEQEMEVEALKAILMDEFQGQTSGQPDRIRPSKLGLESCFSLTAFCIQFGSR